MSTTLTPEQTLDDVLNALDEYDDYEAPRLERRNMRVVWHDDGSSSWVDAPEGIWGISTPIFDGCDAIRGATFTAFCEEWQQELRRREAERLATFVPVFDTDTYEPF